MSSITAWLRRWSTPADALLAVAFVVAAVVESLGNDAAPYPPARAVLGALAVAAVAVRRTFPTVAAGMFAGGMAIESLATEAPDDVAILLACILVSYSVAAHAPRRESVMGGALLVMAVSVALATDHADSGSNIPCTVRHVVGVPFGLGMAMRRRQQHIAALTLETHALAREAEAAVDVERRRIARELHDVVSHAVTLIAVQAEAGQAVIDRDPVAARRSLEAIGQVSREALEELGRLLAVLRDEEPHGEAGLASLSSLVAGVRAAGLSVTVREEGTTDSLDPMADRCAYRVVQEGLTNALRHTRGARVEVVVRRGQSSVLVSVTSQGRRHTSAYGGTGRGLVGLRERVQALGGVLEADSVGEDEFVLRAEIPGLAVVSP